MLEEDENKEENIIEILMVLGLRIISITDSSDHTRV